MEIQSAQRVRALDLVSDEDDISNLHELFYARRALLSE
jgi:hypothetical protein